MKYSLNIWIMMIVYLFIVVITLGLPIGTIQTIQKTEAAEISLIVIAVILLVFLGYLIKTIIAINADPYKSVIVDFDAKQLIIFSKKGFIVNIPFEQVQRVDIIKGEILRGITLGHLRILDTHGTAYSLTISNVNAFYVNLTSYIPMAMDERIFFATK